MCWLRVWRAGYVCDGVHIFQPGSYMFVHKTYIIQRMLKKLFDLRFLHINKKGFKV